MRFIKLIIISIVALFVLMLFFSILMPSKVLVSRAIDINAPMDSIRYRVSDLNQWVYWVKGMRSNTVNIESATKAQLGNSIVTVLTVTDSSVVMNWETHNSTLQKSTMRLISHPGTSVSTVQWQFEQHLKWYPWEKLGSFMNDKILGPMMEQNLLNLKHWAENQPVDLAIPNP
jgi:hypothetical protein